MLPESFNLALFPEPETYSYEITPRAKTHEQLLRSWEVFSETTERHGLTPMWHEEHGVSSFWFDTTDKDKADSIEYSLRRKNTWEDMMTGERLFENIPYYNQHKERPVIRQEDIISVEPCEDGFIKDVENDGVEIAIS